MTVFDEYIFDSEKKKPTFNRHLEKRWSLKVSAPPYTYNLHTHTHMHSRTPCRVKQLNVLKVKP